MDAACCEALGITFGEWPEHRWCCDGKHRCTRCNVQDRCADKGELADALPGPCRVPPPALSTGGDTECGLMERWLESRCLWVRIEYTSRPTSLTPRYIVDCMTHNVERLRGDGGTKAHALALAIAAVWEARLA